MEISPSRILILNGRRGMHRQIIPVSVCVYLPCVLRHHSAISPSGGNTNDCHHLAFYCADIWVDPLYASHACASRSSLPIMDMCVWHVAVSPFGKGEWGLFVEMSVKILLICYMAACNRMFGQSFVE